MQESISILATILAVLGVGLNNRRNRLCFYAFLVSNGLTALVHADADLWSLMVRDAIFFVLAIEGLFRWRRMEVAK